MIDLFQSVQTFGIITAFLFTAYTLYRNTKARQVSTLFEITKSHREIWSRLFDNPELRRILNKDVDLAIVPISENEKLFVSLLILHLNCALEASRHGTTIPIEQQQKDVSHFFRLPIPHRIWLEIRPYQNKDLIDFVERRD